MPNLFPHSPVSMVERMRFITDVRRTATGEWRDSLNDGDYVLDMTFTAPHHEAARVEGRYRSYANDEWYVPLWQDATMVESTITSGQTAITVDTNADYRAGGFAALIQGDEFAEVCPVTSATGGTLTLTTGPTSTYTGSSWNPVVVVPVVTGWLAGGLTRADRDRVSDFSCQFRCPDPANLEAAAFPTHLTYDVVTDETVIYRSLEGGVSQQIEMVANGFGQEDLLEVEEYVRHRGTISALDRTHATRFARRQFIHRARGRDRPFWVPTWKDDLTLRSTVASAATTARTQRISPVDADHVNRSLQFYLSDGTTIHRQITGAAPVGGDSTSIDLTIAAPGTDIPTTATTSLMHLCRFDTDQISVTHTMGNDNTISHFSGPVVEVAA